MSQQQKGYGSRDDDNAARDPDGKVAAKGQPAPYTPPAKLPTQDAWRMLQGALNSLGLAEPYLVVNGTPDAPTLAAAEGLVPLIKHVQGTQP